LGGNCTGGEAYECVEHKAGVTAPGKRFKDFAKVGLFWAFATHIYRLLCILKGIGFGFYCGLRGPWDIKRRKAGVVLNTPRPLIIMNDGRI
jgi:hypothetical protein